MEDEEDMLDEEDPEMELPIPRVKDVVEVIQQWDEGDESIGMQPLKDWTARMQNHPRYLSTYADRKRIYEAYKRAGGTLDLFYQAYGYDKSLKDYKLQIQRKGKEQGLVRQRASRQSLNKGKGTRASTGANAGTFAAAEQETGSQNGDAAIGGGSTTSNDQFGDGRDFMNDVIHPDLDGAT